MIAVVAVYSRLVAKNVFIFKIPVVCSETLKTVMSDTRARVYLFICRSNENGEYKFLRRNRVSSSS